MERAYRLREQTIDPDRALQRRQRMIVNISPSWILTDEHPACSYGQPVLLNKTDQDPFGPGDIVRCYPGWPFQPAREAVARMARTKPGLSKAKRALVAKFIGNAKGGAA
jgi:hypothetical protein